MFSSFDALMYCSHSNLLNRVVLVMVFSAKENAKVFGVLGALGLRVFLLLFGLFKTGEKTSHHGHYLRLDISCTDLQS